MKNSTINTRIIDAPADRVYQAFTQKQALEFWLAPDGMTGKIHEFNFKIGGTYMMSLYYKEAGFDGKTTGNEDRFTSKFMDIVPGRKIVQHISFDSEDQGFNTEMVMEVDLNSLSESRTEVTITFKNIPVGIDPKDNHEGTEQSLNKLSKYLMGQLK